MKKARGGYDVNVFNKLETMPLPRKFNINVRGVFSTQLLSFFFKGCSSSVVSQKLESVLLLIRVLEKMSVWALSMFKNLVFVISVIAKMN